MLQNYIIFGIGIYLAGLILSAVLAFFGKSFKIGAKFFIFSNGIGFLSVLGYFIFSSGYNFDFFKFNWFFEFRSDNCFGRWYWFSLFTMD